MKTRMALIIAVILGTAALVVGLILEPQMPAEMAIHWGTDGMVDGYGSHFMGIWLMPLVIIGASVMMVFLPAIDPRRKNIQKFRDVYNGFIVFFAFFLAYVHLLTLLWNMGMRFELNTYLIPAFGLFVFYVGVMVSQAQSNYFIGIRTPWTLQDERVWLETHRLGGILFKISGIIALLGLIVPRYNFLLLIVPLLASTLITIVYSYFRYRHHNSEGEV